MEALQNERFQAKGFGGDGPLPADQVKSGFAAGTFGWDLAGGDSGRDLNIAGAWLKSSCRAGRFLQESRLGGHWPGKSISSRITAKRLSLPIA